MANASITPASTLDPAEAAKFNQLAATWWDPKGSSGPLHAMNPARLGVIRDCLCVTFQREPKSRTPLEGLALLDLGCGAGLVSEPLARMGATVTAIDGASEAIAVAQSHAARSGLAIDYRCTTAEALVETGVTFDAVISLEVVEHVADVDAYLRAIRALVTPGGVAVLSTLTRTAQSYLTAIVGAEYIALVLPRGTHDWKKFLTPAEMAQRLSDAGFTVDPAIGLNYDLVKGSWHSSRRVTVNYMLTAR
jgi:2-polyprenyl-6-hydroxyphenyl methylase / 3-demethylubiquinone-9 3-methyltransferase